MLYTIYALVWREIFNLGRDRHELLLLELAEEDFSLDVGEALGVAFDHSDVHAALPLRVPVVRRCKISRIIQWATNQHPKLARLGSMWSL